MKENHDELAYFLTALDYLSKNFDWGWQNALSIDTKISDGYISQIINKTRKPSFDIQVKIAKSLGYDYIDFLELGKRLIKEGNDPSRLASIGKRNDILLSETSRKFKKNIPTEPPQSSAYDMLLKSLMDQISGLKDTVKELKEERAKNIADVTRELKRCWDRMDEMQSHMDRMNETIDKMNLLMIDAARAGDISILERISGNGK